MTREEVAQKIHWSRIIWLAGWVNITAMLPQLYTLISTRSSAGLNLKMIWIYLGTQMCFSIHGFFQRDRILMITLGLSAVVSITTLLVAYYLC